MSGSTQGIGYSIAKSLASEGASVTLNGRDEGRVIDAIARLTAEVPGAVIGGIAADFADASAVERLTAALPDLDILVNNVGVFELAPFEQITDETWQRYFDINIMSAVRLSRHAMKTMLRRKQGRIIFISSESGVDVPADMVHYGVTKAATMALSNGLAKLTRGTEITVNTILGGPTYSDGVATTVEHIAAQQSMTPHEMKALIAGANTTSLLQRFIEPEEIADLAVYVASPRSSATNGAALRADGGVLTTLL